MANVRMSLKKLVKKGIYWMVPQGMSSFVIDRLRIILENRKPVRKILQENSKFENCHEGKRCFILATGPSIKKQDLALLKNEICISVSNFFVHKDYDLIRPKYHCMHDVLNAHRIYHNEEYVLKWFRELETRIDDATLFISLGDKSFIEANRLFQNKRVHYLNFGGDWNGAQSSFVDLGRSYLPFPQSVSALALMIALYMGFKEIYLLGYDHDWISHVGSSSHFYEEEEHILATRPGYSEWVECDYELLFRCYWNLWNQYKILHRYAQNKGIKIYNATEGGILDVFPRIEYETLFCHSNG